MKTLSVILSLLDERRIQHLSCSVWEMELVEIRACHSHPQGRKSRWPVVEATLWECCWTCSSDVLSNYALIHMHQQRLMIYYRSLFAFNYKWFSIWHFLNTHASLNRVALPSFFTAEHWRLYGDDDLLCQLIRNRCVPFLMSPTPSSYLNQQDYTWKTSMNSQFFLKKKVVLIVLEIWRRI
jgi:hypothetical protein